MLKSHRLLVQYLRFVLFVLLCFDLCCLLLYRPAFCLLFCNFVLRFGYKDEAYASICPVQDGYFDCEK
ncbi:hypothetical protein L1987_17810 [Smallanthus sonchifolius]|uniref:Uncharacterized protein n=1 Tax=Smallanthus sonchifolius TaxID=185202 RepID=A0ACB9IYU0_9ASTR|nr:hypothetical protein L1987_17810 [Smallanthus sonchifolius]